MDRISIVDPPGCGKTTLARKMNDYFEGRELLHFHNGREVNHFLKELKIKHS